MKTIHSDIGLWEKVNAGYSGFLGNYKPVLCILPTGSLHYSCLIKVEAIVAVWKS